MWGAVREVSLWQRLLGRPVSESGRLRQGAGGYPWGDRPPERANVAYAPMPPLKRKKAFAWITVSAVALTGTGAFAQLGIRETSIVFSLFVRFALAALILAGDGAARASAQ